jgi:hypothetical protein
MDDLYALLLPAGEVPEGGIITKRTGEVRYAVVSKVGFIGHPDVKAERGVKFLLKENEPTHTIYGVADETLVHYRLTLDALESWVRRKVTGPPA